MGKRLKFISEILGVLLLFFVLSNLIAKYYFHTSALEFLLEKTPISSKNENSLQKQMELDLAKYTGQASSITIDDIENKKAQAIPVLVYHGVTRDNDTIEDPTEEISQSNFSEQMFALKKMGYRTITLTEYENFMNGTIELADRSFLLTFDDGIKTSYYNADPILQALGFKAIMYIITRHSTSDETSSYYLTKQEILQMYKSGRWDIQSHGRNDHNLIKINKEGKKGHFISNRMWLDKEDRLETDEEYRQRIVKDLRDSKQDIENLLGNSVTSYAFPFGDYGTEESAKEILTLVGSVYSKYMIQFKTDKRIGYFRNNFSTNPEKKLTRRIKSSENTSTSEFIQIMNASQAKVLPFTANFFQEDNENWVSSNGNLDYTIEKGVMTLNVSTKSASLTTFLDGTYLWTNYVARANAKLVSGKNFSVIAKAIDGSNMVTCTYNTDGITLDQRIDGKRVVLAKTGKNYYLTLSDGAEVGIKVDGKRVECLYNNRSHVVSQTIGVIPNGGIGFGVYSGSKDEAKVEISDVKVYYNDR